MKINNTFSLSFPTYAKPLKPSQTGFFTTKSSHVARGGVYVGVLGVKRREKPVEVRPLQQQRWFNGGNTTRPVKDGGDKTLQPAWARVSLKWLRELHLASPATRETAQQSVGGWSHRGLCQTVPGRTIQLILLLSMQSAHVCVCCLTKHLIGP